MATGQIVVSANTLTAGIRSEFANTYKASYDVVKTRLANVMELGVPSSRLTELYAYYESAPQARLWTRGDAIPVDEFSSVQFSVTNRDFGIRIEWQEQDREDDQTRSLMDRARDAGRSFAQLPERVLFQYMTGATDPDLMPAIPNAPDGAALYSTTDGAGGARFGITNGNLLTGTGVATSAAVRTDFFSAIDQVRGFQDTKGAPLWNDSILESGWTVIYGVHNDQTFREAFIQGRTLDGGAALTNIILDSGLKVSLWATQRIGTGDDDWFIFANTPGKRAMFQQVRRTLRESYGNMSNSDSARQTKVEHIQWDERSGYGVALPYQTVKVNN